MPSRNSDITLLINYLQIGIDSETMAVQQVWGLDPYERWIESTLSMPIYTIGELQGWGDITPGLSYRIGWGEKWSVKFDPITGWVCIGETEMSENDSAIKFAEDTIAVLNNGNLKSLWLKPIFD